ncbi:hypothetical protein AMATHDRAFT_77830 [Amanita thiersii Skay4041]|uniref:UAA transporter n=1 Tax=Amanita thiersii Skay4041 TaxID=703135 RepID=A0A2A9N8F1_9AGAR|nr:hypothetical protein AMATHDRAFT_77830 [Amanita thiersii Skay4041]
MLEWTPTISLIFGGCCRQVAHNAVTLEQLTLAYPHSGSLITFCQFLLISLCGLPNHTTWTPYGPWLKPRIVPLTAYLIQVALFYLISLLNNVAFAYRIPMSVHIIFRSGGLIISMVLGWLVGKRYTLAQALSVLLVTTGVVLTTMSASASVSRTTASDSSSFVDLYTYATGISILVFALILSGILGLVQDWTYSQYGRTPTSSNMNGGMKGQNGAAIGRPSTTTWQESMFYLHFLALPMFYFIRDDISTQLAAINSPGSLKLIFRFDPTFRSSAYRPPFIIAAEPPTIMTLVAEPKPITIMVPMAYLSLLLNTLTQLVCVAGVNRLTTRVSALTVTLVLVVRKATSLVLSVLGTDLIAKYAGAMGEQQTRKVVEVDAQLMWTGAALVMLGTIGYSFGTTRGRSKQKHA